MKQVFIVDESADNLAADLNAIASRDSLGVRVVPFVSPEAMFRALSGETPELVLLHHHWPGIGISQAGYPLDSG